MNIMCDKCGSPIGAQIGPGGRRRFCQQCSPRRDRPDRRKTAARGPRKPPEGTVAGSVAEATRNELEAAGMLHNWRGIVALVLARRIDNGDNETATGLCALVKQLHATLSDVEEFAPVEEPEDPLQRIRRIHAEREAERLADPVASAKHDLGLT